MDLSGWSDAELRKAFDQLVGEAESRTPAMLGALVMIFIGLAGIFSLLDRASHWQIVSIGVGIAGAIWSHRQDRASKSRVEFAAKLRDEMRRREDTRPNHLLQPLRPTLPPS